MDARLALYTQAIQSTTTYVVTKDDIQNNLETIVMLVNVVPGPRVVAVQDKGYGLFAERDYTKGVWGDRALSTLKEST